MNTLNTTVNSTVNFEMNKNTHRYNLMTNMYDMLVDAGLVLKTGLVGTVTVNANNKQFQAFINTKSGDTLTIMVPVLNGELKTTSISIWGSNGEANIMREVARRPFINGKRYTVMMMAAEKVYQDYRNIKANMNYELKLRTEIKELSNELKDIQAGSNTRLRVLAAEGLIAQLNVLNERLAKHLSIGVVNK